ncbi:isocitrate/isopropylmalate dehydrogenase family protein [Sporomusa sp.]|uniref:isocitrate/isopropylmalate dehydrogenase family protein n=1 Tax=Sporomusa sp. TaxID=2078658 RepID=UPI002C06BD36|nr:isocitrate/isopropylmalate dehydrogenase family protein [Sporomusa sp.]HWR43949.1 isocitrate/isopropylmalate dehydrogenase family protein [Sporomusa sp.]
MYKVTLIPGDGIGPEISEAVQNVFAAAGAPVTWEICYAGQAGIVQFNDPLPEQTLASIRRNKVALKGPLTTQVGEGYRSINVSLRKTFDLYCNLRPVKSLPGIKTRYPEGVDLVVFRENTEDLYSGAEHRMGSYAAAGLKIITEDASRRIAQAAFEYATAHGRKKVTAVHKANIMKLTDGLFLSCAREVAKKFPDIHYDEVIIDNLCMQLVIQPQKYDVLLAPNLYGDIISDLCAGLVGGLGVVPGANIGTECAIFEAVHGTAPDIAGRNIANPAAMLMSGGMMLDYLGEKVVANRIRAALEKVLADGEVQTPDLGGKATTSDMAAAIIANLK